jgi:hypothetical protein
MTFNAFDAWRCPIFLRDAWLLVVTGHTHGSFVVNSIFHLVTRDRGGVEFVPACLSLIPPTRHLLIARRSKVADEDAPPLRYLLWGSRKRGRCVLVTPITY